MRVFKTQRIHIYLASTASDRFKILSKIIRAQETNACFKTERENSHFAVSAFALPYSKYQFRGRAFGSLENRQIFFLTK